MVRYKEENFNFFTSAHVVLKSEQGTLILLKIQGLVRRNLSLAG